MMSRTGVAINDGKVISSRPASEVPKATVQPNASENYIDVTAFRQ